MKQTNRFVSFEREGMAFLFEQDPFLLTVTVPAEIFYDLFEEYHRPPGSGPAANKNTLHHLGIIAQEVKKLVDLHGVFEIRLATLFMGANAVLKKIEP